MITLLHIEYVDDCAPSVLASPPVAFPHIDMELDHNDRVDYLVSTLQEVNLLCDNPARSGASYRIRPTSTDLELERYESSQWQSSARKKKAYQC